MIQSTCRSGISDLRADGGGKAKTHGAQTAGGQPRARLVSFEILRREHLVLADIGGDDRFMLGQLVELFDDVLRLDDLIVLLVRRADASFAIP